MRKKVLLLAGCVLASVFMLTGCGESYPQISVHRSEWGGDMDQLDDVNHSV